MTHAPPASEQPLDLVTCPECEAAVPEASRYCWLCGHQMDSPFKGRMAAAPAAIAGSPAQAKSPVSSDPSRDLVLNVSLGAVALMLVLMTAAVWAQEPILGVGLAFVLAPPLAITLIGGLISRLSGSVMTPAKRMLLFVKSTLAMLVVATVTAAIGIIIAAFVIVGLIIALFQACFKMLGGG